jgi:hypothetical protein
MKEAPKGSKIALEAIAIVLPGDDPDAESNTSRKDGEILK